MENVASVKNSTKLSKEKQMAFFNMFKEWSRDVMHENRAFFEERYKIKSMWSLKELVPDYDLMRASATFWDTRRHVFCFSYDEVVPTFEDFRALLGGPEVEEIAVPLPGGVSFVDKLSSFFQISSEEAQGMIRGPDYFDISGIPDRFRGLALVGDVYWDAFALCVLGSLYMVYSFGICHRALLDVVVHCRSGRDIVPLVLGETFHALDRLATGKRYMHGGSPFLLTMWLMERLSILREAPPTVMPWTFARRGVDIDFEDQGAWERWMARRRTRDIRWWVPHWRIETRRVVQEGSHVVMLPGLSLSSFYIPGLVLRQFGMEQTPLSGCDDIATLAVASVSMDDPSSFLLFSRVWRYHVFPPKVLLRHPERIILTTEYLDWYERHMGETQVILMRRREALVGPEDLTVSESRRAAARANPRDRSGDDMIDYEARVERQRDRTPMTSARRQEMRDEARTTRALIDAGLMDPPPMPELGRRRTDIFPVQRKNTRHGGRRRKRGGDAST